MAAITAETGSDTGRSAPGSAKYADAREEAGGEAGSGIIDNLIGIEVLAHLARRHHNTPAFARQQAETSWQPASPPNPIAKN
jgi:Zn-dependent M28 family amino/carboxypeptidase